MTMHQGRAVVGVFSDASKAQQAVQALRNAGFTDDQIGVIGRDARRTTNTGDDDTNDSYAAEGAATGVAAGAGLGALWGLGILAGVMPVIGPAIAGGALAAVLSSAAAGAAAAGLGGALVGMGIPKDEAEYYESEFQAGRTLVTVTAPARETEARTILRQFGGHDRSSAEMSGSATSSGAMSGSACNVGSAQKSSSQGFADSTCHTSHAGGSALQGTAASTGTHASSAKPFAGGSGDACSTGSHQSGQTVKAVSEELNVQKVPKQGEVNVRKEVHTEHKTIEVPVMREEVVVERTHPGTHATGGNMGSQEIRVPVREEEIRVEKTPVVKEEVRVSKRQVQDTERVSETLRKEEIKVDTKGSASVRDDRKKR
jgi:uncharacterized protein (TIGR02271 family)